MRTGIFGLFLFFFILNNIQAQEINYEVSDLLLSEDFGYEYVGRTLSEERDRRDKLAETIYYDFIKLYQNKKYKEAILKIEDAIKQVPHGVFYYYYGNCFMLINNYKYAEKAYLKAITMFDWIFNQWWQIYNNEKDFCYTFDNNGMAREEYFTYYNLACTYSIINKLDLAFINLKKALEYSYPYIDHLFKDPDLNNLFNSSEDIKKQIQKIYDDGFINKFTGKAFHFARASDVDYYYFIDDKNIRNESNRDFGYARSGIYEVKNYLIIAKYSRERGRRGINPVPGGGVMGAYEKYEPYKNQINKTEIISIIKMSDLWEEISFQSDPDDLMEIIPDKKITKEINENTTDDSIDNQTILDEQQNDIKNNNILIYIIIGILSIVILISLLLFFVKRKKK
jgi:tetratricopeptide (TPR) repeat protein